MRKPVAKKVSGKTTGKDRLAAYNIAVLVPCYNEELAIGKVVRDFQTELPAATIFVFDNNSSDGTFAAVQAAGAEVFREPHQGKGHVVR
ncbi:MAG: glycosyltransferase, partial [Pseudolabrys sp.]|nr:glycosyltransferase [Pseudolabrys sp.]